MLQRKTETLDADRGHCGPSGKDYFEIGSNNIANEQSGKRRQRVTYHLRRHGYAEAKKGVPIRRLGLEDIDGNIFNFVTVEKMMMIF